MKYFKEKSATRSLSLFGPNSLFQGRMILKEETRIAGRIEGSILTEEFLIIEESAFMQGEIEGIKVEISGRFKGTLKVSDVLHLTATADVEGELIVSKIVVEEGAKLRGSIVYLSQETNEALEVEEEALLPTT
jgi:cytoskeletal protein CcmA (bactofilin family)